MEAICRPIETANVSKSDIARHIGVSPSLVTAWTKGRCAMQPKHAERLGELIGADPRELLRIYGDEPLRRILAAC